MICFRTFVEFIPLHEKWLQSLGFLINEIRNKQLHIHDICKQSEINKRTIKRIELKINNKHFNV
jgi:hypothetical protein